MGAGRPALFKSETELEAKIAEYYESCKIKLIKKAETDEEDDEYSEGDTVTITGLAYFLGFESRQSFYDYEKHEEFSYIIKRARLKVESEYEKRLQHNSPTGSIFALKNMGWTDKQEIDQKTELSGNVGFTGIEIIKPNAESIPQIPS